MEYSPQHSQEALLKAQKIFEVAEHAVEWMAHDWAIEITYAQYTPKFLHEPNTPDYKVLESEQQDEYKAALLRWVIPRSNALIHQAQLRHNIHNGGGAKVLLFSPKTQPDLRKVPYKMLWTSEKGLRGPYAIELLKTSWAHPYSKFQQPPAIEAQQITIRGVSGSTLPAEPNNLESALSVCLINGVPYIPRVTQIVPPSTDTAEIQFSFLSANDYPGELETILQVCQEIDKIEHGFGSYPKTESI